MPQPDSKEFYSELLSNFAVALIQSDENFIASKVFPVVDVERQSATYNIWDPNAFLRDEMQLRAPADESAGSGYKVSSDTYNALVWALHKDLSNQDVANWTAKTMTPEQSVVRYLTHQGLQRRERQWVTKYFASSVWATDTTPSVLWSDPTNSDPIGDVRAQKTARLKATGFEPNTLTVGYEVHQKLVDHPDIVARISGAASPSQPAVVTRQALAAIFEVENYYVARAVKATNVENETAAVDFIHGKHALLCYVDPMAGPEAPTAGVTFAWTGGDMQGLSMAISAIPKPLGKATRYEVEMAWDDKVVSSSLGAFFPSVIA